MASQAITLKLIFLVNEVSDQPSTKSGLRCMMDVTLNWKPTLNIRQDKRNNHRVAVILVCPAELALMRYNKHLVFVPITCLHEFQPCETVFFPAFGSSSLSCMTLPLSLEIVEYFHSFYLFKLFICKEKVPHLCCFCCNSSIHIVFSLLLVAGVDR